MPKMLQIVEPAEDNSRVKSISRIKHFTGDDARPHLSERVQVASDVWLTVCAIDHPDDAGSGITLYVYFKAPSKTIGELMERNRDAWKTAT